MVGKTSKFDKAPKARSSRAGLNAFSLKQKTKPLLSVRQPPVFSLTSKKDKPEKPLSRLTRFADEEIQVPTTDDQLWADRYAPESEAELAVHKRKVEDVRRWFQEAFDGGPNGKLRKYRRILALTGPAGTGKTTTIRVLAKEMGFEVSEWRSSIEEAYLDDDLDRESHMRKFEKFLARASQCRTLLGTPPQSSSSASLSRSDQDSKQIILLKELPNILHEPTQNSLHAILESFLESPPGVPLVIIISETSTRGEFRDERIAENGGGSSSRDNVDIRTVLPSTMINGPFVRQIQFNPIAPTLMQRALQVLLTKHAANDLSKDALASKEELTMVVENSNGDIRSSIMALQFSCVMGVRRNAGKSQKGKSRSAGPNTRVLMESITRREQSLALFHMIGKIFYNKRKGDPPSTSLSAKEKLRDQELDSRLKVPKPLPPWLSAHERCPSRVDVETLYADSPVDTGLFALYIHQNYTQFCSEVDECDALNDWLSWIDCSGGEKWYQANPHQFHLLTLGALHALPSPVARRGQKFFKPDFFDNRRKVQEAEDAIGDVQVWMQDSTGVRWNRSLIALEMGAVLKAKSKAGCKPPPTHRAFTTLTFSHGIASDSGALEEDGDNIYEPEYTGYEEASQHASNRESDICGSWLNDDEIEEF